MYRKSGKYHTGVDDGFKPRLPLDISKIEDFDDMLMAMESTAFGARQLGKAADVLFKMADDKDTFVVLTLSGAMTPAGMGLLICEMIEQGLVHAVISTGALMTHGFVEASGGSHFQCKPGKMDDMILFENGYDRIHDVLELERNLDCAGIILNEVLGQIRQKHSLSSRIILRALGKRLVESTKDRGILKSAYLNNIPVYVPAFTDSEMGLEMALYNRRRIAEGEEPLSFNPFSDLEHFLELFNQQKKLGIFTIGGGVPRNWAQQAAPYLDVIQSRMPEGRVPVHLESKRFSYAVRICPDSVEWGGLSGCTYEEGKSWGKFEPDCEYAEVISDATMAWPFIVKAVIQRLRKHGIPVVKKNFDLRDQLKRVSELSFKYKLEGQHPV